jgi:hypothetical protein
MMMQQLCSNGFYLCWDTVVLIECSDTGMDLLMNSADQTDVSKLVCVFFKFQIKLLNEVTDFRGTQYAIEGGTVDSFHH